MNLVLSCCLILCFIWLAECVDRNKNKACYQAKICIHNNNEKCGVNSNGRYRRFLDSCDIMEYNCLRGTDYQKTQYEYCSKLPPMKDEPDGQSAADEQSKDSVSHDKSINPEISESTESENGSEEELNGEEDKNIVQLKHVEKIENDGEEDKANIAQLKHVDTEVDQANVARLKNVRKGVEAVDKRGTGRQKFVPVAANADRKKKQKSRKK